MASKILQQGCLRLSKEEGLVTKNKLKVNVEYKFSKEGHRLYMLDTPIELMTQDWKIIARIVIDQLTIGKGMTLGSYRILKIYTDEEERIVSGTVIPYTDLKKTI